jgi:hypothetical protein
MFDGQQLLAFQCIKSRYFSRLVIVPEKYMIPYIQYALLGTNAGRRTFICNALSLSISPQVVMKWTRHNDYKAMKPYIDITDDIKVSAMDKFHQL